MNTNLFAEFAPLIENLSTADLADEIANPEKLLLGASVVRGKRMEVAYAPFDYINTDAKIVIVGLTPGRQQMGNALTEARRQLCSGVLVHDACAAAKVFASFSGPLRANLIRLLDDIGVARFLKIDTTASLWGKDSHLVQFTSALRYPVFRERENYKGTPKILSTPFLMNQLTSYFASEMRQLPDALYVPLGGEASQAVAAIASDVGLRTNQILSGLPHPSRENGERIKYFLGEKARAALSRKTNPDLLDAARASLCQKIAGLA